jgi:ABC-type transport system involved in Fe-S cluster assembly fused permease/ATPase subunit
VLYLLPHQVNLNFLNMSEDKIMTLHPQGKNGVNISRAKYDQVKKVVLLLIMKQQPITFSDMFDQANEILKEANFEGKPGWYVTVVKLDLEARKKIERIPKTSPHQLRLV